jgi:bifunctional ADP-heptose synthase (sugar kinase/adenylyltransferase)
VSIEPIVNVIKKRYIDINSGYHLIRVDNDEVVDKPNIVTENIYPEMERIIDEEGISIVSLLDYRKGMFFNHITCRDMISLCRNKRIPVYVDTRCSPIKFRGANYLKLNNLEYAAAKKELNIDDPYEMIRRLEISSLIVTRGKDGATLYGSQTGSETNIHPREYNGTPDVTGCGDVFGVNFCDYISMGREKYKSKYNMEIDAVKEAVDRASFFAYQNIGDRL